MLFKELIKELRHYFAESQTELAVRLEIDQTTISFYERGLREPNFKTLRKVVDYANKHANMKLNYNDIEIK